MPNLEVLSLKVSNGRNKLLRYKGRGFQGSEFKWRPKLSRSLRRVWGKGLQTEKTTRAWGTQGWEKKATWLVPSDSSHIAARGNVTGRPRLASHRWEQADGWNGTGFSQMPWSYSDLKLPVYRITQIYPYCHGSSIQSSSLKSLESSREYVAYRGGVVVTYQTKPWVAILDKFSIHN